MIFCIFTQQTTGISAFYVIIVIQIICFLYYTIILTTLCVTTVFYLKIQLEQNERSSVEALLKPL